MTPARPPRPVFIVTLRPLPGVDPVRPLPGVDPVRALRAALKVLKRRFGADKSTARLLNRVIHRQTGDLFPRHAGAVYPVSVESQQECPPFYQRTTSVEVVSGHAWPSPS